MNDPLPTWDVLDRPRRSRGSGAVALELGDLRIGFHGLDAELEAKLRRRLGPYVTQAPSGGLDVDVRDDPREYFIVPPPRPELNRVVLDCDGERVRYLGHQAAGSFPIRGGTGQLVLSRGRFEPVERAFENYLRVAVAWLAAQRGGGLIHAASAVRDGRGYLFYGESGAGKSTLAACSRRGRIVSDDLSLVLPGADGRPDLVGSPFRGTYEGGAPVTGRFPLVAGFRIVQSAEAAVRPVSRARALAELVGNLPFVAEAFAQRPDLLAGVERAFREVPLAHLLFRKDDSYWDAIEQAGL